VARDGGGGSDLGQRSGVFVISWQRSWTLGAFQRSQSSNPYLRLSKNLGLSFSAVVVGK
jgi:hypothetical protein